MTTPVASHRVSRETLTGRANREKSERKEREIKSSRRFELTSMLRSYTARWRATEDTKCAQDRRGAKFMASKMWDGGGPRLAITSNSGKALLERRIAMTTKSQPEPIVEAVDPDEDDAARVLTGALVTNWKNQRMQELLKRGERLTAATRPIAWYVYWDRDAHGGIGDFKTRVIPAHRFIYDERHYSIKDMEFAGFVEKATRANLIKLFPEKVEEIESATMSPRNDSLLNGKINNPLSLANDGPNKKFATGSVSTDNGATYRSVRGTSTGKKFGNQYDSLAEEVEVEYLWIQDNTPIEKEVPKFVKGRTQHKPMRDENGQIKYTHEGYETVDTPWGPVNQPILKPELEMVMEKEIVRKYPYWRHVAYIPMDDIILWDVKWDGPIPLVVQRDSIAIDGFHSVGSAHELFSLAIARNWLLTSVFEKLRKSMGGSYFANISSGLKTNRLSAEAGMVYPVRDINGIKAIENSPIDASNYQLLQIIESEMERLIGLPPVTQGESAGRADAPQTYEQLIEQGGVVVLDHGQMIEQTISDWAEIAMWFAQSYYTTEHIVEIEKEDGMSDWVQAANLSMRGTFAVRVDSGSTLNHSPSARLAMAKDAAAMGIYSKVYLAKEGRVPNWKPALRQMAKIQSDPNLHWLMGAAGAPPATQNQAIRAGGKRSHHKPGSGK